MILRAHSAEENQARAQQVATVAVEFGEDGRPVRRRECPPGRILLSRYEPEKPEDGDVPEGKFWSPAYTTNPEIASEATGVAPPAWRFCLWVTAEELVEKFDIGGKRWSQAAGPIREMTNVVPIPWSRVILTPIETDAVTDFTQPTGLVD